MEGIETSKQSNNITNQEPFSNQNVTSFSVPDIPRSACEEDALPLTPWVDEKQTLRHQPLLNKRLEEE